MSGVDGAVKLNSLHAPSVKNTETEKKKKSVSAFVVPKNEEKPEEKKAPPEKQAEPIYYIVERKTRRAKPAYGEPKQINFKGQN